MTRHRRDRLHTVPATGIRPPRRIGSAAWVDLDPMEAACVAWLYRREEAREQLSARALMKELRISDHVARAFVVGPWLAWVQNEIAKSRTSLGLQLVDGKEVPGPGEKLRAAVEPQLGPHSRKAYNYDVTDIESEGS